MLRGACGSGRLLREIWAGGPGQSRTADFRFRKSLTPTDNKADTSLPSAESGKVLQNPQPPRNKKAR